MSDEIELGTDDNGFPILLAARAPGQVAAQRTSGAVVKRGARSGNENADPASGRFTSPSGSGKKDDQVVAQTQTRTIPQGLTVDQFERRQDIVRDLAREMDDLDDGDMKEFLKRYPSVDFSKVRIDLLKQDVRAQRLDDLVDILDSQMRGRVAGMKRGRRTVKIAAPKGFQKRVFAGLEDEEVLKLVKRLEGKGWDPEDLTKHVISRVADEERRTKLEQLYGQKAPKKGKKVSLEDPFEPEPVLLDEEDEEDDDPVPAQGATPVELADALGRVASQMPAPVVNVNVEAPKPTRKIVTRNPDTKLIDEVKEVPDE